MVDIKKVLTKILDRLAKLKGFVVSADDYYGNNTSGQTHTYTMEAGKVYMLVVARINSTSATGVYIIGANATTSGVTALSELASSTGSVSTSGLTLSVVISVNYTRVTLIKLGG